MVTHDPIAFVSGLQRVSSALCQHFERTTLHAADLHWSAFVTLCCLWRHGPLETRRLAHLAGVAKSTLSNILNGLEQRELVRRRVNQSERRLVTADLTAAGIDLINALLPKYKTEEARIVSQLSLHTIETMADAIGVILSAITGLNGSCEEHLPLRDPGARSPWHVLVL